METGKDEKRCKDCHIDHLPSDYHAGDSTTPGRSKRAKARKAGRIAELENALRELLMACTAHGPRDLAFGACVVLLGIVAGAAVGMMR